MYVSENVVNLMTYSMIHSLTYLLKTYSITSRVTIHVTEMDPW